MKDNKHTPGPWEVSYSLDNSAFVVNGDKYICCIETEDGDRLTIEDESNLRLIASAPSLKAENEALKTQLNAQSDYSYLLKAENERLREALGIVLSELGEWLDAADDQFGRESNEAYQTGETALK